MYFKYSTSAVGLLHEYFPKSAFHVVGRNSRAIWQVFTLECPRMRLERFKCCWNTIRMFRKQLEFSWNSVGIHFLLECSWNVLSMSKTFQPPTRMGQNSWNAVGSFRTQLEYPGIDKEFSFQLHSCSFFL